jgi:hypothetical protein
VIAACGGSAPQTPTPQPPQRPVVREPPRVCVAIDAHCDPEIQDAAVLELVKGRCWGCHGTNGIAGHDFPDIATLRKAPVDYMIGSCQMPPDGAPLAEAARQLLVDWASCKQPVSAAGYGGNVMFGSRPFFFAPSPFGM